MSDVVRSQDAIDKHLERMDAVVAEHLKGSSPREIAKTLGLTTGQVGSTLREWRQLVSNNEAMKERAAVAVRGADEHYAKLIKEAYETLEIAKETDSNNQRMNAIKLIVDIEKTRFDMLQKAGALEDNDLARQMLETERKQEIVVGILKEVVGPCKRCRPLVQNKLAEMTNEVVVIKAEPSE